MVIAYNGVSIQAEGAMPILAGVAANKSIASGLPVKIDELIKF